MSSLLSDYRNRSPEHFVDDKIPLDFAKKQNWILLDLYGPQGKIWVVSPINRSDSQVHFFDFYDGSYSSGSELPGIATANGDDDSDSGDEDNS